MTDSEAPKPHTAPAKKGCLAAVLVTLVLLAGIATAVYRYCPWQKYLVPIEEEQKKLEALQQRLTLLEELVKEEKAVIQTSGETTTEPLNEEIEKLKARIDAKESKESKDEHTTQKAIAALFAYWDVRDVSDQGRPFTAQLDTLRLAAEQDDGALALIEKIAPYANKGAPPLATLREELVAAEKNIPSPEEETAVPSFLATLKKRLRPLIFIHPVRDPRLISVEQALAAHNANEALEIVNTLPDSIRISLEPWRLRLDARVNLDAALKSLMTYYSRLPEPRAAL